MSFMPSVALVRKIAALLLACCFVLPLSTCSQKASTDQSSAARETTLYGFNMVREAAEDIAAATPEGAFWLMSVLCVFFVPLLSLKLGAKAQSFVGIACAGPAIYMLFFWVFVFVTSPRFGGVLAMVCWVIVFFSSLVTLWQLWRGGRLFGAKAARVTGAAQAVDS